MPLQWLAEQEVGLLFLVFLWLDGASCARISIVSQWTMKSAKDASKERISSIISCSGVLLSRWRYSGSSMPFRDQLDLECAEGHFRKIAGRYEVNDRGYVCILDVEPDGSFRNYGEAHEMVGQGSIAGIVHARDAPESLLRIVPAEMRLCHICKLDRWYTRTVIEGQEVTFDQLEFTGPGYQTYSVHAWLEPSDGSSVLDGAFMENHPRPTCEEGWDLAENTVRDPWFRSLRWPDLERLRNGRAS
eukprot:TRINITY_DN29276_c0_g1_i1.p1 TRINITY_DN29276_c0_g1~~TRINITY_DN29276_c0_g1_i1.p1  ORF type:complete len:245 (+),score=14.63 TRINITY_DN29276_c0_g1_i1:47-781(+)